VIRSIVVLKQGTLIVLPTGFGKSLSSSVVAFRF